MIFLLACHPEQTAATPKESAVSTPEVAGPALPELLEAEDLDPDPAILHVSLVASAEGENYHYNGQRPGPLLKAPLHSRLLVDFENQLSVDSTIHWHGIAAPEAMDGAVWLSQPVPASGRFSYEIPLGHAGTFWYHPHVDVAQQVDRGLYGAIVVTDPADPWVDQDRVLVFDANGEVTSQDDHGLLDPQNLQWTINGVVDPVMTVEGGQTVRLRLINVSNLAYLDLSFPEIRQIAGDQGLRGLETPDRLILAPGDRAELELRVSESFEVLQTPFVPAGGATTLPASRIFQVQVTSPAEPPAPKPWPDSQPPTSDPSYTDLHIVFTGDGDQWRINGEAWPDITPLQLPLHQASVIEVRNLSSTNHPFHLHGNSFEVLSLNGIPPALQTVEDTVDVPIDGILRIQLTPSNPGDWMLHCHLLEHEDGGMMTVLQIR